MANTDLRKKLAMMIENCPVTLSGVPPITTSKRRLIWLKAFGGTEQNGTPTPDNPVDIVCNNGVLRTHVSATGTVTQTGDPTPTQPIYPVFYQKGDLVLRAIGEDADTYDVSTQKINRNIGYKIFDGTESFGVSTAFGRALYITSASGHWGANRSKDVLCQYFLGASSPSGTMSEFNCFFNARGHFYFRTNETAANFKAWLAELYANGTPLIVWFVKGTSTTESFTPSVYAEGTVETINVHGKNFLDLSSFVLGKYLNANGVEQNGGYGYSGIIKVVPGEKYTYNATYSDSSTQTRIHGYQDGVWVQQLYSGNASYWPHTITIPTNVNGVRISIYPTPTNPQFELGSTATAYEPYFNGGTATTEMLLKVGDYQDVQSILDGVVTRNVGIKVLDGTENFNSSVLTNCWSLNPSIGQGNFTDRTVYCTHFNHSATLLPSSDKQGYAFIGKSGDFYTIGFGATTQFPTEAQFKQWLADQYTNGTPVIVVYPLATPTTEQVAGQTMALTRGTNVIDITQASLNNLELEIKAK